MPIAAFFDSCRGIGTLGHKARWRFGLVRNARPGQNEAEIDGYVRNAGLTSTLANCVLLRIVFSCELCSMRPFLNTLIFSERWLGLFGQFF
jgi:hypothetical protein